MATLEQTPRQALDQLEHDLGVTSPDLAAAVGASPRTLERWRADETYPQRAARERLAQLLQLDRRLRDTFSDTVAVREWLHAPNHSLGGFSPVAALRLGRVDRVEAALDALDAGIFV
jgi:putative toxin-antitoxin system antitoxin component (TIGR02293 family)